MNQNDMDRYFWRTGQRWSADNRSIRELRGEIRIPRRAMWWLLVALLVTTVTLWWPRFGS